MYGKILSGDHRVMGAYCVMPTLKRSVVCCIKYNPKSSFEEIPVQRMKSEPSVSP